MSDAVQRRLRQSLDAQPAGLRAHVLRVVVEAQRLAPVHGIDASAATVAALGHDLLRALAAEDFLGIAERQGYPSDDADRMEPILLHGPLAVRLLRDEYGIDDDDVLGAVAAHTTARPGMTRLQKLLFVADKIEPEKVARKPTLTRVRELAERDLDAAALAYLDHLLRAAADGGWPLHPNTIAARNELLAARS